MSIKVCAPCRPYQCNDFRDDKFDLCHETRNMPSVAPQSASVIGRRMRQLREQNGWSQEKVGVEIGIDESSSRARISRYELGIHEPPVPTARLIANVLGVPLTFLYCEDDGIAALLLGLHRLGDVDRGRLVIEFSDRLSALSESGKVQPDL